MMIAYASRTGTRRNLAVLARYGWRLMLSPEGVLRTEGFRYAMDNGAWSAYQQKREWNEQRFYAAVEKFGRDADFVVCPDVVCGGAASLALSLRHLPRLQQQTEQVLFAVQDGMESSDIAPHVGASVGIFVGGSDQWKEMSMERWGQLAREAGCWLHVGRCNTGRRVRLANLAGATSFDGTGPSRFSAALRAPNAARQCVSLKFGERA
jgi:hypothetical protein